MSPLDRLAGTSQIRVKNTFVQLSTPPTPIGNFTQCSSPKRRRSLATSRVERSMFTDTSPKVVSVTTTLLQSGKEVNFLTAPSSVATCLSPMALTLAQKDLLPRALDDTYFDCRRLGKSPVRKEDFIQRCYRDDDAEVLPDSTDAEPLKNQPPLERDIQSHSWEEIDAQNQSTGIRGFPKLDSAAFRSNSRSLEHFVPPMPAEIPGLRRGCQTITHHELTRYSSLATSSLRGQDSMSANTFPNIRSMTLGEKSTPFAHIPSLPSNTSLAPLLCSKLTDSIGLETPPAAGGSSPATPPEKPLIDLEEGLELLQRSGLWDTSCWPDTSPCSPIAHSFSGVMTPTPLGAYDGIGYDFAFCLDAPGGTPDTTADCSPTSPSRNAASMLSALTKQQKSASEDARGTQPHLTRLLDSMNQRPPPSVNLWPRDDTGNNRHTPGKEGLGLLPQAVVPPDIRYPTKSTVSYRGGFAPTRSVARREVRSEVKSEDSPAQSPKPLTREEAKSAGSNLHPQECRPCAFFWTKGCINGVDCRFCHEWHPPKKKKPMKEQKNLMIIARPDGKIEFMRCTIQDALRVL